MPGGVVAVRDADYAAMTWFPADPRLDRWIAVYSGVTRSNAAEPDAGRRLRGWALAAGFGEVSSSASTWCFAPSRSAGGGPACGPTGYGVPRWPSRRWTAARLAVTSSTTWPRAWREWAERDDGWFAVLHGEVLARG